MATQPLDEIEPRWDAELAAMARDREIQRELQCIGIEFHATEADGLGPV